MSDKKESLFDNSIDILRKLINDPSTEEDTLRKFAESPESEESAFNLMRIDGDSLSSESKSRLIHFGKLRMAHLKKQFSSTGGGRNMTGKMEYDTIKDVMKDLK